VRAERLRRKRERESTTDKLHRQTAKARCTILLIRPVYHKIHNYRGICELTPFLEPAIELEDLPAKTDLTLACSGVRKRPVTL